MWKGTLEENCSRYEPFHDKPIRPVWSESSLCAQWVAKDPSFLHADSKDSDQTGRMHRLIWVFAGRTVILLVLSWGGSYFDDTSYKYHKKTCRAQETITLLYTLCPFESCEIAVCDKIVLALYLEKKIEVLMKLHTIIKQQKTTWKA